MTTTPTEHSLFRPLPRKAALKADITSEAAGAIISAEAEHRNAKTARLRAARLASESLPPPAGVDTPKRGTRKRSAS